MQQKVSMYIKKKIIRTGSFGPLETVVIPIIWDALISRVTALVSTITKVTVSLLLCRKI